MSPHPPISSASSPPLPHPLPPSSAPASSASLWLPSALRHLAPVVPALAFGVLAACLLNVLFRACRHRVQKMLIRSRQTVQRQCRQRMSASTSTTEGSDLDPTSTVTPWELQFGSGSNPGSPLFLLQHPDLLFPPSPLFAYPHSPFPPFFLIHPDGRRMPPKYEDALKLPPPPGTSPLVPPQHLCIPALADRARFTVDQQQSPPPCYESARAVADAEQREQRDAEAPFSRLFLRRRENPPTYSASVEDLTSADYSDYAPGGLSASASAGAGVALSPALSDRPCSSCSLVDDPRALVERRLHTFVAKSARKQREAAAEGGGTATMPWGAGNEQ